jgi:hypothetical protein
MLILSQIQQDIYRKTFPIRKAVGMKNVCFAQFFYLLITFVYIFFRFIQT